MAARALARRSAGADPAASMARVERALAARLPRYVQRKKLADGSYGYYWAVPPARRPDLTVRHLALGTDRAAAIAIANLMHAAADAARLDIARAKTAVRTAQARSFAALDEISRHRALTDAESRLLEDLMIDLGMIPQDQSAAR
ncbi:hypothetical protein [Rhizorhabdus sp.]|uniref:hypothetical protein n=1 Tax=Rhizorhabdus sp. TaxID=1968843 RepID=UPI0035AFCB18